MRLKTHLRRDGIRYLDEVMTRAVQEFINTLSRKLKPCTVKNYATTFTSFFNAVLADDIVGIDDAHVTLPLAGDEPADNRSANSLTRKPATASQSMVAVRAYFIVSDTAIKRGINLQPLATELLLGHQ